MKSSSDEELTSSLSLVTWKQFTNLRQRQQVEQQLTRNWGPMPWTPTWALLLAAARLAPHLTTWSLLNPGCPQGTSAGWEWGALGEMQSLHISAGTWSCQLCYFSLSIRCGTPSGFHLFSLQSLLNIFSGFWLPSCIFFGKVSF